MLNKNSTPQEIVESSLVLKTAFGADFTDINSERSLKEAFNQKVSELVYAMRYTVESLQSVAEVLEAFHFSTLAGVMLQLKADKQYQNIINSAETGQSLASMVLSQFKGVVDYDNECADPFNTYGSGSNYVSLAKQIGNSFQYTGKAMRAMVMVSIMSFCSCKTNSMANAYEILSSYEPTSMLLNTATEFSLIGKLEVAQNIFDTYKYSVPATARYAVEQDTLHNFGDVYKNKIIELFSRVDMTAIDRARVEELRDFYADTLSRFFFQLRLLNFPRVLSLIDAVNKHANADGVIDEDTLNAIVPHECVNLLGNEAILSKTSIDLNTTWYKVNNGVNSFAILAKQFNLFSAYKQALLEEIIS